MESDSCFQSGGGGGRVRVCLLCPNKIPSSSPPQNTSAPAAATEGVVSVKNLLQYLKIGRTSTMRYFDALLLLNVNKFIIPGGGRGGGVVVEEVIAAGICEQCSSFADLFGGIYQDYETARLLLTGCVQMLNERVSKKVIRVDGGSSGVSSPRGETNNMDSWKAEILRRCDAALKFQPRVELKVIDELMVRYYEDKSSSSPPSANASAPPQTEDTSMPNNLREEEVLYKAEVGKAEVALKKKVLASRFSCLYCGKPSATSGDNKRHMLSVHPIQRLSPQIPSATTTTPEEFAKVTKDIRVKCFIPRRDSTSTAVFQCGMCGRRVRGRDKKLHLLQHHIDIIVSSLATQKTTSTKKLKKKKKKPVAIMKTVSQVPLPQARSKVDTARKSIKSSRFPCPYSLSHSHYLCTKSSLKFHMLTSHTLQHVS